MWIVDYNAYDEYVSVLQRAGTQKRSHGHWEIRYFGHSASEKRLEATIKNKPLKSTP